MGSPLLLILAISRIQPVLSSGSAWWADESDKNFWEAVVFMGLTTLAILFDLVWHSSHHHAKHTYQFGKHRRPGHGDGHGRDHSLKHLGHEHHKRLYYELAKRVSMEFMTLGCLAFVVFVCNQASLFDTIAEAANIAAGYHGSGGSSSGSGSAASGSLLALETPLLGISHPLTALDWLHLAEEVHIRIFVGMLFYFIMVYNIVRGSVDFIRDREELMHRARAYQEAKQRDRESKGKHANKAVLAHTAGITFDRNLALYIAKSEFFIQRMLEWEKLRPKLYEDLKKTVFSEMYGDSRLETMEKNGKFHKELKARLQKRFILARYFALSIEEGVLDCIQMHVLSWVVLVALFGVFSILHLFCKVRMFHISMIVIALSVFMLSLVYIAVHRESRTIMQALTKKHALTAHREKESVQEHKKIQRAQTFAKMGRKGCGVRALRLFEAFNQAFSTETLFMRVFEVMLFVVCYTFATVMVDTYGWQQHLDESTLQSSIFVAILALSNHFLPNLVPTFLAQMALPPNVDDQNFLDLQRVLTQVDPALAAEKEKEKERQMQLMKYWHLDLDEDHDRDSQNASQTWTQDTNGNHTAADPEGPRLRIGAPKVTAEELKLLSKEELAIVHHAEASLQNMRKAFVEAARYRWQASLCQDPTRTEPTQSPSTAVKGQELQPEQFTLPVEEDELTPLQRPIVIIPGFGAETQDTSN